MPSLLTRITLRDLRELVQRTVKDSIEDRVLGLSAEVAFFALFSLPPTLLALLGAAGYIGDALGPTVTARITDYLVEASSTVLTENAVHTLVEPTLTALLSQGRVDIFSIGVLFAIWSASRAAHVWLDALRIAYDIDVKRPIWRRRAIALLFTVGGILLGAVILPVLVAGPRLGAALVEPLGMTSTFAAIWRVIYWPVTATAAVLVLATMYHFAIPWKTPFVRDLPGAILALVMWLIVSASLRTYASWTMASSSLYGSLAAPMVVLLWLYFTSLSMLVGAELNAEIEKMWPTVTAKEKEEIARQLAAEVAAELSEDAEREGEAS